MNWYQAGMTQGFKWTRANLAGHSGIDLGMPVGTVITSPVTGVVMGCTYHDWGGQVDVVCALDGRNYVFSFLHLAQIDSGLRPGLHIWGGTTLGLSGGVNAGPHPTLPAYSNGPHLHFEVSAGALGPYTSSYNPRRATSVNYPVDPSGFLAEIKAYGGVMSGIPSGWHDNGTVLTAPGSTIPVHTGMRNLVLNSEWAPDNVPLEPERDVNRIALSGGTPDLSGAGVVQTFRYSRAYWNRHSGNLGLVPLGADMLAAEQENAGYVTQLNDLHTQNSALQTQIVQLQTAYDQLKQASGPAPSGAPSPDADSAAVAALAAALRPLLTA